MTNRKDKNGVLAIENPELIEMLHVDSLIFDPENPRIPSNINKENEPAVFEWMLDEGNIIELMWSIAQNNYFKAEPLLVIKSKKHKGKYEVIEGNRRLSAVKLLRTPKLAPVRANAVAEVSAVTETSLEELPCIVYSKRDNILEYLGYRHITGIKPWSSLAKAKYLRDLRNTLKIKDVNKQFASLAKTIGSNPSYVARLLTALAIFEEIEANEFYGVPGLNEQTVDFSLITTALQYSGLIKFLGLISNTDPNIKKLNSGHLEDLTKWFYERLPNGSTRLGESRNIRKLNAVVQNNTSLKYFKNGAPLDDAAQLTGLPEEVFRESVMKAQAQLQIGRDHVHRVKDPNEADITALADIADLANYLHSSLEDVLSKKKKVSGAPARR